MFFKLRSNLYYFKWLLINYDFIYFTKKLKIDPGNYFEYIGKNWKNGKFSIFATGFRFSAIIFVFNLYYTQVVVIKISLKSFFVLFLIIVQT